MEQIGGVLLRLYLGAVFLYAGVTKALDARSALGAVHAYDVLPRALERPVAVGLPWLEIVLGVLLLLGLFTRPAGAGTAALSLVFAAAMTQAMMRDLQIGCGCFGGAGGALGPGASLGSATAGGSLTWVDVARDVPLLLGSLYLAWRNDGPWRLDHLAGRRSTRIAAAALCAAAAAATVALASPSALGGGPAMMTSGSVTVSGSPRTTPIEAGSKLPAFSAPTLDGGRISLSTYRGEPVVLIIWTPGCPMCEKELPIILREARRWPNLAAISIVAGGWGTASSARAYLRANRLSLPAALDSRDEILTDAFGVAGFPTVYYVQSDGMVHRATVGAAPQAVVRGLMRAIATTRDTER